MKSFLNYLFEQEGQVDEAGIKFDDKYEFPKSDNILFMAGGAGSGKGFVLGNLLLFDGKVLNKDDIQTELMLYMQKHPESEMAKKFKAKFGDIPKDQLSPRKTQTNVINPKTGNPERYNDTEKLHHFAKGYYDSQLDSFFKSAAKSSTGKPNIIFDITGSELDDFTKRVKMAEEAGYDKKNIHIAWIVTDVASAIDNNAARDRYVPIKILRKSHSDVKNTMMQLLWMEYPKLKEIFDGHFFIIFNNKQNKDLKVSTHRDRNAVKDLKGKAIWTEPGDPDWMTKKGGVPREKAYVACHAKEPGKPVDWNAVKEFDDKIIEYLMPAQMTRGDRLDMALDILDDDQIAKYEDYVRTQKAAHVNLTNTDKLRYVMNMMNVKQLATLKNNEPQYKQDVVDKFLEEND